MTPVKPHTAVVSVDGDQTQAWGKHDTVVHTPLEHRIKDNEWIKSNLTLVGPHTAISDDGNMTKTWGKHDTVIVRVRTTRKHRAKDNEYMKVVCPRMNKVTVRTARIRDQKIMNI